jgi:hypothetical protein
MAIRKPKAVDVAKEKQPKELKDMTPGELDKLTPEGHETRVVGDQKAFFGIQRN